jgi:hypothetical protein
MIKRYKTDAEFLMEAVQDRHYVELGDQVYDIYPQGQAGKA